MPIDTIRERFAIASVTLTQSVLPPPDGFIQTIDRYTLLWRYPVRTFQPFELTQRDTHVKVGDGTDAYMSIAESDDAYAKVPADGSDAFVKLASASAYVKTGAANARTIT